MESQLLCLALDEMPQLLQALVKSAPNVVHAMDDMDQTPLHAAAKAGSTECVRALLATGAHVHPGALEELDTELRGTLSSPLHSAAAAGQLACLQLLIAATETNSSTLDVQDSFGRTPLHFAAAGGHSGCALALLAAGASASCHNRWGATALHFAVKGSHDSVSRELIAAGADVNAIDNYALSPLHVAAEVGDAAAVRTLLAAGACMAAQDARAETALSLAVRAAEAGTVEVLATAGAPLHGAAPHFADMDATVRGVLRRHVRGVSMAAVGSLTKLELAAAAAGGSDAALTRDLHHAILCRVFDVDEPFLRLLLNSAAEGC